jgi:N4-gp56 family major capsid protein
MALTQIDTSNNLRVTKWAERLFEDTMKESYFSQFESTGEETPVQVNRELEKGQGEKVTFGLISRLAAGGVTSRQQLEGNEEALSDLDFSVELEEYAHAVRDQGPLDRKRPVYVVAEKATKALRVWGTEKVDELAFTEIQNSPSVVFAPNSTFKYASTPLATAKAALTTSDKITLNFLSRVKTWCKTGGNRGQTPLRPVMIAGKKYYVFLTHPDSLYDLKADSEFKQAMREADTRGSENKLFTGATAVYDGVIIHEHENMNIDTLAGSGSNVPFAQGVFMGAQALVKAVGQTPRIVPDEFDYDRQHGWSYQMMLRFKKAVFNSKDYGAVGIALARTQTADK